jgi:hypothetical protein
MTLTKILLLMVGLTVVSAAAGLGIGYGVGLWMPNYYRALFSHSGEQPWFNPAEIGASLGLTQGVIVGVFLSLVLVGILVWRERRAQAQLASEEVREELHQLHMAIRRVQEQVGNRQPETTGPVRPEQFGFRRRGEAP